MAVFEWLTNHAPVDPSNHTKMELCVCRFRCKETVAWVEAHLNGELMQLQVKNPHHKKVTLDVPCCATVGDALAAYAGKFGVCKDAIRLVHQGQTLEPLGTLASYGIGAGGTVRLKYAPIRG